MPLREIAGPAGRIEALFDAPVLSRAVGDEGLLSSGHEGVRAAVVLGHPHTQMGGTIHTKAVYQSAKALSRIGCAVLRINFRGAGSSAGAFDNGPGETADFRAALDFMGDRFPDAPLWAGGMSFGSWIGMTAGAIDPRVSVLIGIAPPVSHYDFESVARSDKAKFFIHGERDEICSLKDMRAFYGRCAEPKELVVIDAADHVFDGRVGEVADAIEALLEDWNG
jgi:alpha/beta superfamily hydrolase